MLDQYVDEGIPFLRSQNILPFRITTDNLKFISTSFHQRLRKSALRPGDVAVVRTGYPGTAAVVPDWLVEANCADLVVITPGSELDAFFLAAVFNSTWGVASVGGALVGSAQQHFNIGAARRLELHVPPLQTQRKITAILSAYDDLIENNNRRIKLLEEMFHRIHREWFVDFRYPGHEDVPIVDSRLGAIPERWRWTELRELAAESRIGVDPGTVDPATPYIGLEHMPERSIAIAEWGLASQAGSQKYEFKMGDVLFGKIRPYFHKVAVPPVEGICSTDAIVIRSRAPSLSGLVLAVVSSDAFVEEAVQTSQGTKMPRANWNVLERYPVALPPQSLIESFGSFMDDTVAVIHRLVMSNRNLGAARDLLLPRLVSGEIDVTDLNIAMPQVAA